MYIVFKTESYGKSGIFRNPGKILSQNLDFTGGGLLINVYFGGWEFEQLKKPPFRGDYRLRLFAVQKTFSPVAEKNTLFPGNSPGIWPRSGTQIWTSEIAYLELF